MSERDQGVEGPRISPVRIYRWVIRGFPVPFRDRFGGELLQVLSADLRYSRTDASPFRRGGRILGNIKDLIASAICERFMPWRILMNKNSILQSLGVALIASWVMMFGWSLAFTYSGLKVLDPSELVLGPSQSNLEVLLWDGGMLLGPLLAFISFLIPILRLKFQTGEGELVQLSIRQPSRIGLVLLGASGLLTALWLGLIITAKLLA